MKKLTLLLLLISSICFGQTTKTDGNKRLYREYSVNRTKPLLIYLHGAGERGTNPAVIDGVSFVRNFASKHLSEYTIVAPQQSKNYNGWQGDPNSTHDGVEFVRWAIKNYPHDGRVYVTGFSAGGHGTWDVVTLMQDTITAFVVCAGRSDNYKGVLEMSKKHIPGRHYHGNLDTSENSYARGKQVTGWYAFENGNILITYFLYGHGDKCYSEPDLNSWILSKGKPILPEPPGLYLNGKFCGTDSCKVDSNNTVTIIK